MRAASARRSPAIVLSNRLRRGRVFGNLISMKSDRSAKSQFDVVTLKASFVDKLFTLRATFPQIATPNDNYLAMSYAVRAALLRRYVHTAHAHYEQSVRSVAYLSAEFQIGPQLGHNLLSLGIRDVTELAANQLGLSLPDLLEQEAEPGLGSGGLGRLAACFLDSLASLEIPATGYGIRYEFGFFDQSIREGWQVEVLEHWLRLGFPWEVSHPEIAFRVGFGGHTEHYQDEKGRHRVRWVPNEILKGMPYDIPILGYGTNTANSLRLWQANAYTLLDLRAFNQGDYVGAYEQRILSENITKVLYPQDDSDAGRMLRLQQQYFLVSCSLQDMFRKYEIHRASADRFHEKYAIQLNDTHPSLAIAELMRILVDEKELTWETAWECTVQCFGYTNHTLLPESLERWPVDLIKQLLPRHLEIIYEINRRFLNEVRLSCPDDTAKVARVSLIDEEGRRSVRMANLAVVGCHAVNGVSRMHSDRLKASTFRDFAHLWPEKFLNVTNGVSPRRFLLLANPRLCALISDAIGNQWTSDLVLLRDLEKFASTREFQRRWREVKRDSKLALATRAEQIGWAAKLDPDSMFDCQVKRIHEYKRQHLNLLHAICLYLRLKRDHTRDEAPRTILFGGKAAPGYRMAKVLIKLIHGVADVVNNDRDMRGQLRIEFLRDLNSKSSQLIYPAADLSEQISVAGSEASGTDNMKFALNGAITIGTLDGANIEIREEVGSESFFLFGLTVDEVDRRRTEGYRPRDIYERNGELREAIDLIGSGFFSGGDRTVFEALVRTLLDRDEFMVLADFASYVECQRRVARAFMNTEEWARLSILNTARMGKFSSDRAVREYCESIWKVGPVRVVLGPDEQLGRSQIKRGKADSRAL